MMLAEAVTDCNVGPLKNFSMTDEDRHELKIAGLLHDCGKITTPVHVVDKATKLETIYDRIGAIDARFEVVRRDAEIVMLRAELGGGHRAPGAERDFGARLREIDEDREFLRFANIGSEAMDPEHVQRVRG